MHSVTMPFIFGRRPPVSVADCLFHCLFTNAKVVCIASMLMTRERERERKTQRERARERERWRATDSRIRVHCFSHDNDKSEVPPVHHRSPSCRTHLGKAELSASDMMYELRLCSEAPFDLLRLLQHCRRMRKHCILRAVVSSLSRSIS